ncbi:MAG TPA: cysteine methyltransferase [Bacteroidales bacterium]|nr:MAG: hypothetical protein A2W98_01970 [Bacteroidetes bacterium GWF2_33_38]OFY75108.1 MAG: hypothetical protein A2265_11385 [Bacteroidetes bacterium RIFOXYA12_FULL_33_9]OFY85234.1 MAG: hypothetical protein A2236_10345 [Bacteroidetes bacterium RIFOXYA2_FULL_33_7]HBF88416.1 cysteine methyltransferase [Bacteroidales bacterium]
MIQRKKIEIKVDIAYYNSPIGLIEIKGTDKGISSLTFIEGEYENVENKEIPTNLNDCITQLDEYFNHKRKIFSVKLDLIGSPFQEDVWQAIQSIPFGETSSYIDLATKIRNKAIVRAVGNANSHNPVLIIVPCHRIIGTKGSLTGYSGGLWRKDWLLNFERNFVQQSLF